MLAVSNYNPPAAQHELEARMKRFRDNAAWILGMSLALGVAGGCDREPAPSPPKNPPTPVPQAEGGARVGSQALAAQRGDKMIRPGEVGYGPV